MNSTDMILLCGNSLDDLKKLPDQSVHCCVTSPPYWGLRDYGKDGQLGLEKTPDEYVSNLVEIFREVRRVLRDDGTVWLNLGDSYAARLRQSGKEYAGKITQSSQGVLTEIKRNLPSDLKEKDLCGIPWRVAVALQADGWWLRQDIIWHKPNPMPESVTDRCTKAHEYIFLLSKCPGPTIWKAKDTDEWSNTPDLSETLPSQDPYNYELPISRWRGYQYYYNAEAIAEDAIFAGDVKDYTGDQKNNDTDPVMQATRPKGRKIVVKDTRNRRSVWTIATQPYPEAHFATFPEELPRLCILAGCPPSGTVLDPFCGSGTTGLVARKLGNSFIGIDLNEKYLEMARRRILSIPRNILAGAL